MNGPRALVLAAEYASGGESDVLESLANGRQVGLARFGQPQALGQALKQGIFEMPLEHSHAVSDIRVG